MLTQNKGLTSPDSLDFGRNSSDKSENAVTGVWAKTKSVCRWESRGPVALRET